MRGRSSARVSREPRTLPVARNPPACREIPGRCRSLETRPLPWVEASGGLDFEKAEPDPLRMEARLDGVAPAACGRLGVCASVANLVRLKFLSADRLCPCGGVAALGEAGPVEGLSPARAGRGVLVSHLSLCRSPIVCPCGGVATARCGVGSRHWVFGVALARPPGVVLSAVPGPFDVEVRFALRAVTRPVLGNGTELVENRGQVRDALGIPHDVGVGLEVGKD